MNGDTASSTLANQELIDRKKGMNKYEGSIGLPIITPRTDECEYLDITGNEISKFTPEQCGEAATDLAAYSIYIQRLLGREKGILRWLEAKIDLSIAGELNSYSGYYSHNQRRAVAIINNAYAKELEDMRINSQIKVDSLEGLTYQINQLCRVLLEAQSQKRHQRNHG